MKTGQKQKNVNDRCRTMFKDVLLLYGSCLVASSSSSKNLSIFHSNAYMRCAVRCCAMRMNAVVAGYINISNKKKCVEMVILFTYAIQVICSVLSQHIEKERKRNDRISLLRDTLLCAATLVC